MKEIVMKDRYVTLTSKPIFGKRLIEFGQIGGVGSVPIVVVGVAAAEGGDDATPMGKKFKHGNLRVKQNLEKARSRSRRRQRMGHHSPWWISIYS
ncbi:hypothetical protein HN51_053821 [Arachis hypogaea]